MPAPEVWKAGVRGERCLSFHVPTESASSLQAIAGSRRLRTEIVGTSGEGSTVMVCTRSQKRMRSFIEKGIPALIQTTRAVSGSAA